MPAISYRPRRSVWSYLAWPVLLSLFVLGGTVVLWTIGFLKVPWLSSPPPRVAPEGWISVPISAQTIPAYTKIARDHLFDPTTGAWRTIFLDPKTLPPGTVLDAKGLLGRVLRQDKAAGYLFKESDLLPEGTRPGLVAGIPPGKRAIRVEAEQVKGLVDLQAGDRFDLVATLPIQNKPSDFQKLPVSGAFGKQLALHATISGFAKQANVEVVAQNGVVVIPLRTRLIPYSVNTLTRGAVNKTKPVQEIVIAVDPEEVSLVTKALAIEAELLCVPRSGNPEGGDAAATPSLRSWNPFGGPIANSLAPMVMVESIQGESREIVPVPQANSNRVVPLEASHSK